MTNIVLIALAIIIVSLLGFVIWSFWRRSDRETEPIQPPEETSPSQKEIHDSPETSVSSEVKVEDEQQLPPKESEDLLDTEEQDPASILPPEQRSEPVQGKVEISAAVTDISDAPEISPVAEVSTDTPSTATGIPETQPSEVSATQPLQPDQPQDSVDDVSEYLPDDTGRITVPGIDPESAIHTGEQPSTTPEGTEDDVADPKLESQETLPEISQSSPIPAAVKQPVGTDPAEQEVDSSSIPGDISPPEVEALKDSEPSPALEDISVPRVSTETLPDSAADRPLEQEVEESAIPETESEETTPSDSSSKESTPNGPQQGFEEASADHPQEMATHEVSIPETGFLPTTTTPLEEPQSQIGDQVPVTTLQAPKKKRKALIKAARKYRPPVRFPSPPQEPSASPTKTAGTKRALSVAVRLIFEHGGFCRLSLLPQRNPQLPTDLTISGSGGPFDLSALQDEWFQDVFPNDMGRLLKEGIVWEAKKGGHLIAEWSLSGREVYVLSGFPSGLRGFVSRPRLGLRQQHVVLCTINRLEDVRQAIQETGSPDPELLDQSMGLPEGWVALRGVHPQRAIPPEPESVPNILEVLHPNADIEISLEAGIQVERFTWLDGHPPEIRIYGEQDLISQVFIDGEISERQEDGSYIAPGWNLVGRHKIWCAGLEHSYSIAEGHEEWEPWDACVFSECETEQQGTRPGGAAICGPLLCNSFDCQENMHQLIVPPSNPLLIGSRPGDLFRCARRRDIRGAHCVESVPFDAVWALPQHPHHSDKSTTRIILVGNPQYVQIPVDGPPVNRRLRQDFVSWCIAILDASRKGLQTDPDTDEVISLWRHYKRQAKSFRKAMR